MWNKLRPNFTILQLTRAELHCKQKQTLSVLMVRNSDVLHGYLREKKKKQTILPSIPVSSQQHGEAAVGVREPKLEWKNTGLS